MSMEKRNFVTSVRTPKAGADDVDDILEAGAASFGRPCALRGDGAFSKMSSAEDEKSDS